jgi:hypothetical protein
MLWLLKLLNPLVLEIREGRVTKVKGSIPSNALREIQGVIAEAGARRATIHADGAGRLHFSPGIPAECRQMLRNILVPLS